MTVLQFPCASSATVLVSERPQSREIGVRRDGIYDAPAATIISSHRTCSLAISPFICGYGYVFPEPSCCGVLVDDGVAATSVISCCVINANSQQCSFR